MPAIGHCVTTARPFSPCQNGPSFRCHRQYNPLVALYDGVSRRYDKSWAVVHKAQKSKRWLAPELLERLRKDSGRND